MGSNLATEFMNLSSIQPVTRETEEGHMADMDCAKLAGVKNPLAITEPEKVPSRRYYDEEFYRLECEEMWPRVWQMACRLEQIPNVGDWVEYSNVGQSVIVVRTEEGVKAFQNHCRHRGVKLAGRKDKKHGNCAKMGFICPFHGWTWNMDGEATWIYGKEKFSQGLLDADDVGLVPVRCETWGGFAYINFDDDALSFRETLGPILGKQDIHSIGNVRAEWWFATEIPANWKIAMEAFMEGYHVMATHPQLQKALPEMHEDRYGDAGLIGAPVKRDLTPREAVSHFHDYYEQISEGMAGGMCQQKEMEVARKLDKIDLPDSIPEAKASWIRQLKDGITESLRERGEAVPDLVAADAEAPMNTCEFLFPNQFVLRLFSSFTSYRIRPLGPEKCLFEIWAMTHYPEGQEPAPVMAPTVLPYDSDQFPIIPRQDYSNIPLQQEGLHSAGFEFMRLSKDLEGLISNYQQVIDGHIAGVDRVRLARAIHALASGFDGPVINQGFS